MLTRVQTRFSHILQIVGLAVVTLLVAVLTEQQTISSNSALSGLKKLNRAHHTDLHRAKFHTAFCPASLRLKIEESTDRPGVTRRPLQFFVQSAASRLRGGSQNEAYGVQSAIDNEHHLSPPYDNAVEGSQTIPGQDQHANEGGEDGIALHDGWYQYFDEAQGLPYYYNVVTGVTEWEMPEQSPVGPTVAARRQPYQPTRSLSEPREAVTQHAGAVPILSIPPYSLTSSTYILCVFVMLELVTPSGLQG